MIMAAIDSDALEPVFTVAEHLKLDQETLCRLLLREPGVLVFCFPQRGRRTCRTIRVPEPVLRRLLARFTPSSHRLTPERVATTPLRIGGLSAWSPPVHETPHPRSASRRSLRGGIPERADLRGPAF
jgi:hypothetical protein